MLANKFFVLSRINGFLKLGVRDETYRCKVSKRLGIGKKHVDNSHECCFSFSPTQSGANWIRLVTLVPQVRNHVSTQPAQLYIVIPGSSFSRCLFSCFIFFMPSRKATRGEWERAKKIRSRTTRGSLEGGDKIKDTTPIPNRMNSKHELTRTNLDLPLKPAFYDSFSFFYLRRKKLCIWTCIVRGVKESTHNSILRYCVGQNCS